MAANTLVEIIRDYLEHLVAAGIPSPSGVLFGSFARGDANPDSDIDLLVVSPVFDGEKRRDLVDTLWRLTWRTDSRIEPIPVGAREFESDDVSPLVEAARREGIVIEMGSARKSGAYRREWPAPQSATVVAEDQAEYPRQDDDAKA